MELCQGFLTTAAKARPVIEFDDGVLATTFVTVTMLVTNSVTTLVIV